MIGFCNVHAMCFLRGRNRTFIHNLAKTLRFIRFILDPDYGTNRNLPFVTHEDTEILKKQLKGRHFSSDTEVIAAAETWLDGQPSEFFLSGLQTLEQRAKKCIELRGEYVE